MQQALRVGGRAVSVRVAVPTAVTSYARFCSCTCFRLEIAWLILFTGSLCTITRPFFVCGLQRVTRQPRRLAIAQPRKDA